MTRPAKQLRIHLDDGGTYGDLTVAGFHTDRLALEIGALFADALRGRYPGVRVTVDLDDAAESK